MYIKPKKSLGQNFLVDQNIQRKIIEACDLSPEDIVLEIGAGRGELTRLIAPRVKKVYALEIDSSIIPALKSNTLEFKNIKIIHKDVLKADLTAYIKERSRRVKVIGNIPYYISTPILERLFKARKILGAIYLTVQREFAERLAAGSGSKDYGSLSCFVQYYAEPKIKFFIKNNSFFPVPKVDSAFIEIKIRQKSLLSERRELMFFRVVRSAFNQRRKILRNSLKQAISQDSLEKFLLASSLDPNIRPEKLTLLNFLDLAKIAKIPK